MHLEVVTPAGKLLEAEVSEVTAPGTAGEFGVLPGHVPLLTGLRPGVVRWRGQGAQPAGALAVGKGFAEVVGDRILVLVDVGAKPDQIDAAAARKDLAAAQQDLLSATSDAASRADAEQRRDWAQARLDTK